MSEGAFLWKEKRKECLETMKYVRDHTPWNSYQVYIHDYGDFGMPKKVREEFRQAVLKDYHLNRINPKARFNSHGVVFYW